MRGLIAAGLVWALLVTLAIVREHQAWADGPGEAAPGNSAATPAASNSPPASAAASAPAPPPSLSMMVKPLQMAAPNAVDLTSLVPALSRIPSPIADLLKLDINGVVSGIGTLQNHAVSGDFRDQVDVANAEIILQSLTA